MSIGLPDSNCSHSKEDKGNNSLNICPSIAVKLEISLQLQGRDIKSITKDPNYTEMCHPSISQMQIQMQMLEVDLSMLSK